VWKGTGGEEINVETLALQYYEKMGYKGCVCLVIVRYVILSLVFRFHSEGRIVCTIFGLLFWDILFADVPGAFETPYQSAPLDIAEDCFYHAREGLIKDRLTKIEQGNARKILEKVDDEHRSKGTWCVGVRWDMFAKQDLLEIVDVSLPVNLMDVNAEIL
jgi:fanconi-associated nuclease 1